MDKDKNFLIPSRGCNDNKIHLQAGFFKSALEKNSKPDLRLITLVKLLARQAAEEQFKVELVASNKVKNKQKNN